MKNKTTSSAPSRKDAYMGARKSSDMAPTKSPRSERSPRALAPTSSPRTQSAPRVENMNSFVGGTTSRAPSSGPSTVTTATKSNLAPTKSKRPMSAAPARAVRAGQAMLDRSARLGDSGPMNAGTAFRAKKGFKSGGAVKGGSGCKTY